MMNTFEERMRSMTKEEILSNATAQFFGKKRLAMTENNDGYVNEAWCDLVIRFGVFLGVAEETRGIAWITKEFLSCGNITEEEFKKAAFDNLRGKEKISTLGGIMIEIAAENDSITIEESEVAQVNEFPLVITNESADGGAIYITDKDLMRSLSDKCGGEDLYILPSSVHEVLIFPENRLVADAREMLDMVRSINATVLSTRDFLSDNIYVYNRDSETWSVLS